MSIDFMSGLNNVGQYAFSSVFLNSVVGNSVMLALVISIIMILLIMIFYPAKKNTGCFVLFKIFIYSFLISSFVIFLHDGVMKYHYLEKIENRDNAAILGGLTSNGKDPAYEYYNTMQTNNNQNITNSAINTSNQINTNSQQDVKPIPFTTLIGPKPPPPPSNPYV